MHLATDQNDPTAPTLNTCDQERIHQLGRVQPFGALLGVSPDWIITHQSANLFEVLGRPPVDLVGESIETLIDADAWAALRKAARALEVPGAVERSFGVRLIDGRGRFDVALHMSARTLIIEIEPHAPLPEGDLVSQMRPVIAQFRQSDSISECADLAVRWIRSLTGFDRVMVYRFLEDGSGEVISERCAQGQEPYRGLRFPASDIPRQARALYLRNPFRIIADVDDPGSPVHPERTAEGVVLDLSHAATRAVSPIHLEYLRNMGVRASLSVSLIREGALWGLIACHHSSPRTLPYSVRSAAELFGQLMSFAIEQKEAEWEAAEMDLAQRLHDRILSRVAETKRIDRSFEEIVEALGEAVSFDGAVGWIDGAFHSLGETPTRDEFLPVLRMLNTASPGKIFATDRLGEVCPAAADIAAHASGLLALPVSRKPRDYIVLFRRGIARSVVWAGKPKKDLEFGPNGPRLTPRKSFEAWRERVSGRSAPWRPGEQRVAEAIRVTRLEVLPRITDETSRERAASQQRQELLIAELNHRVRNILGLIGNLVGQSADNAASLEEFTDLVGGRIAAMSRAHDQINRHDWDGASLVELLRTEATAFLQDGAARIRVEGADAVLKPQAFSTVALVMHEMITNAAKYGALRDRNGGVDIRLEETVEGALRIDWREWGGPPVRPPTREGFGSTIVERSIPYELAGEAEVEHKVSGVRARFRIPPSQILEFADLPEARRACGGEAVPSSIKGTVLVVEDMLLLAMGAE
ncbi:MAG: HWE histidine kinase domain-containing protein [Pseudomonadota bacterium]